MTRILLRSSKYPWTAVSAEQALAQNTIANNAGNLVFGQAVHRILSVPGTEIVPDSYLSGRPGADDHYAARINAEYDAFVVPLANAFRPAFADNLKRMTRIIRKLEIPVVVVGVGSQQPLKGADAREDPIAVEVKDFMAAVLDRSASVGVRGEATASYLKELGFGDSHVDIIGCPSVFFNGPSPRVEKRVEALDPGSRISLNISPYVKAMAPIAASHLERYANLVYVPQVRDDLALMLWGEQKEPVKNPGMPVHTGHPLYLQDRMRFPLDPRTWIEHLRGFEFSFGTRIHGNIAAILAGTPAMVLAHDSRTLELAEYHQIPYRRITELPQGVDAAELYAETDYTGFHAGLPERFARYTAFLERNGLAHIHQDGQANTEFDDLLGAAGLPPMVGTVMGEGPEARAAFLSRLHWLHQGHAVDRMRTAYKYEAPFAPDVEPAPDLPALQAEIRRLTRELEGLKDRMRPRQSAPVRRLARRIRSLIGT